MVNEIGSVASLPATALRGVTSAFPPSFNAGVVASKALQPNPDGSAVSISGGAVPGYRTSQADESLLEAALGMRQAQDVLSKADRILADIQSNLSQVVKQYPPFGVESPERIKYLNAITGLRKQLDALEFPPQKQTEQGVPAPRFPDSASLQVPELDPKAAPDEAVQSALDFVIRARDVLTQSREQMWADVQHFLGANAASEAVDKANSVREFVALHPGIGLGVGKRQLVALSA